MTVFPVGVGAAYGEGGELLPSAWLWVPCLLFTISMKQCSRENKHRSQGGKPYLKPIDVCRR